MQKNEKGFGVVEILLVIVIIGLIIAVGWLFFDKQRDNKPKDSNATNMVSQQTDKEPQKNQAQQEQKIVEKRVTITPFLGTKSFTVALPNGWERNTRISEVSPVYSKTVEGITYFISFVNGEINTLQTDSPGYSTEGFLNQSGYKNTTLKSLITTKGTKIYLVKSLNESTGGGLLLLSSSQPNPTNSYIKYEGQNLGINVQRDGNQASAEIDFSSPGIDTLISDFETITKSLDI